MRNRPRSIGSALRARTSEFKPSPDGRHPIGNPIPESPMVARSAAVLLAASLAVGAAPVLPCPTCKSAASADAATALKGVWLSIESPVNPFVDENRGVILMVHTFWMRGPARAALEGRAEGTVNGQRQTLPLTFQDRGEGVYALTQSWPREGRWALVITGRN